MSYKNIIWIFVCLLYMPLNGQILKVKASFESDSMMIGQQINYVFTVESDADVNVTLPEYSDTLTEEIEILQSLAVDTLYYQDRRIITRKYIVTSFAPGWNTIPPQPVAFQKEDLIDTIYTTAALLTVLAPDVNTEDAFRPIKPPVNTPLSLAEIIPWIFIGYGGLLLLTLIAALVYIYFRKSSDPEIFKPKVLEPAHIVAFRDLEILKEQNLPQQGRIKEYYTRLTEIIRIYITRQFEIHAMESTSHEILEAFSIQNTGDNDLLDMLEKLLMLADLVKFAREDPTESENIMHLQNAIAFVEKTYGMFYNVNDLESTDTQSENENILEPVKEEVDNG